MRKIYKKMLCAILCISMLCSGLFITEIKAATFNDINQASVFVKQNTNYTCTLAAATMMVRRAAMASGNSNWSNITESAMRGTAWLEGTGLYNNFTYAGIKVSNGSMNGGSNNANQLISLLQSHPEGIVIYDWDIPHAILITDYTNGTFYCADPANNIAAGRIPISKASISINNADKYWYVSSPKITLESLNQTPIGKLDSISGGVNSISIYGWAFDPDAMNETVWIHVYVDDVFIGETPANKERSDVDNVHDCGEYHGFNTTFEYNVATTGKHKVQVYALDTTYGEPATLLATKEVTIEACATPVVSNIKVQTDDMGYTITCDVSGVSKVQFPTWTVANGQDDINRAWETSEDCAGTINGNTVTYRVDYAEHNNEMGLYFTHIYPYDEKGNKKESINLAIYASKDETYGATPIAEVKHNNKKYILLEVDGCTGDKMSWTEALTYCQSIGGNLVTITSQEENELVYNLIKSYGAVWIGADDYAEEGTFVWTTGEPFTYTNWLENQPDNKDGTTGAAQNAACMRQSGGWDDDTVSKCKGFVCEFGCTDSTHKWSEWIVVEEATCKEVGEEARVCANCNEKESKEIPMTDHEYSSEWTIDVEATTTSEGNKSRHCVNCDAKTDVIVIPKLEQVSEGGILSLTNATGCVGDVVDVFINLQENPGIVGATLVVGYDPEKLELVSCQDLGVLNDYQFSDIKRVPFILNWEDALADENNISNGNIAKLQFKILEDLGEDGEVLSLSIDTIYDVNIEDVEFSTSNGKIGMKKYTPGDVNDDGTINSKDSILLRKYILGSNASINLDAADVNRDGIINSKDSIILRKYILGGNVELK